MIGLEGFISVSVVQPRMMLDANSVKVDCDLLAFKRTQQSEIPERRGRFLISNNFS